MSGPAATEFVYVGDVMCSWCWGFAPTLQRLEENFQIPIRVVNGGLRPGPNAQELDDHTAEVLSDHWDHVEKASGQPFDRGFLSRRDGWVYDTELPAIAVVTMRTLRRDSTLAFFQSLQQAFYSKGVDVTAPQEYDGLLSGFDVDHADFLAHMATAEMKSHAWNDFEESRALGISGFPALLLRIDGQPAVVARGYAAYEQIEMPLVNFLRDQMGDERLGEVCSIEGVC